MGQGVVKLQRKFLVDMSYRPKTYTKCVNFG